MSIRTSWSLLQRTRDERELKSDDIERPMGYNVKVDGRLGLQMPVRPRAISNSPFTTMGGDDKKTLDDVQVVTSVDKEKKKKKKRSEKVEKADEDENKSPPPVKKSKKRKHSEAETAESEAQPKKKKHKNKTGFPDPSEDSSLSEQARRGGRLHTITSLNDV